MTAPDPRVGEIEARPVAFHKLRREQLLTLAIALQDQRDNALAELRKAHEALERVEEVHRPRQFNPISDGVYFGQTEFDHNICAHDHERWPCPTAAAVAAANGDGRG